MTIIPDQGLVQATEPRTHTASLLRNPLVVGSAGVLLLLCLVALLRPWITPFPPGQVIVQLTNAPPFTSQYLLGGDRYGRDILSLLIAGAPDAIKSSIILTVTAVGLGVLAGLLAGYFGTWVDSVALWVFGVLIAVPGIIILIALYTVVGVSSETAMVTLGVLSAPGVFFLVRTLTRSVRNELYVDAARVSGLSSSRVIGRHVLLAIRGPVVILAAFLAGAAIAISAGLEFIGLGSRDGFTWGGMLNDAFTNYFIAPWQLIFPGLALGIAMAAFVLLGNGLRDTLQGGVPTRVGPRTRRAQVRALGGAPAVARTLGGRQVFTTKDSTPRVVVDSIEVGYPSGEDLRLVVKGVSFTVEPGEVVGLVGESGSGKTQTVFSILGLLPEQAIVAGGSITWRGGELLGLSDGTWADIRKTDIGYIPQEPSSNLDPNFRIGSQLVEAIRAQTGLSRKDAVERATALLTRVGIRDANAVMRQYPHEISGGMAQRVLIAGAVASHPAILIADEPTTALDVTVQSEVLDLLRELRAEMGMSILIVTHNLGVVADLCDRVVVMRDGTVVEQGLTADVLTSPAHEYTQSLVNAVLELDSSAVDDLDAREETGSHA